MDGLTGLWGLLLSFGLAKGYANHPWSVTEPEAVGVPGWQKQEPLSIQHNTTVTTTYIPRINNDFRNVSALREID